MRVVLVVAVIALAGAGGYGYFDLTKKLNETQRRLETAETIIAKDRHTLGVVCNEYASAPKVERHLDHHQAQLNGLRDEVRHVKGTYAVARKVDVLLGDINRQLKDQSAGLKNQGASLGANVAEVRSMLAAILAQIGLDQLRAKRPTDAEWALRFCLSIREVTAVDDWRTFNTKSMLGESLLGQKKYADAEPLLLAGYEGLKQRETKIPEQVRTRRLTRAMERLVDLYDAWNKKDKADPWRQKLKAGK